MPRLKAFDQKFGPSFIEQIPALPGIYRVFDAQGQLIYVGKAKNLKRRLGQYRNAKRFKKHHKMRAIINDASSLECEVCTSETEALLLELQVIQEKRPKWNVAGAFYFLYPLIGVREDQGVWSFCYTTSPEKFSDFDFHGAFRSRWIAGEAFFSLMELLEYVGHRKSKKARVPGSYSYLYSFRQLPEEWKWIWGDFLSGTSKEALEVLILALVENAAARRAGPRVQQCVNSLVRFWRHEVLPLASARRKAGCSEYPVSQRNRDLLFIKSGLRKSS